MLYEVITRKNKQSSPLNVLCTNFETTLKSDSSAFTTKSYGERSSKSIKRFAFLIMLLRCPHDIVADRNPAISISSFRENLCGIEIGSESIKSDRLYLDNRSSNINFISASSLIIASQSYAENERFIF